LRRGRGKVRNLSAKSSRGEGKSGHLGGRGRAESCEFRRSLALLLGLFAEEGGPLVPGSLRPYGKQLEKETGGEIARLRG